MARAQRKFFRAAFLAATGMLGAGRAAAQDAAGEAARPVDEIGLGRRVYARYCAGCHGAGGDGKGEAGQFLNPKPRDLTSGEFKFSSRPTPDPPTDDDLMQLLVNGLKGTAMPAFGRLPEAELRAVIAFVKTLSPRWGEPMADPIEIGEDPFAANPGRGIDFGDRVYHVDAMCYTCHPAYHSVDRIAEMTRAAGYEPNDLRPNAHLPVPQPGPDGALTLPPDFARDWIKTGAHPRNLYRVIGAGITTTAMPTWVDTLSAEQLWGLAYYVGSRAWNERKYRLDPSEYVPRPRLDLPLTAPESGATTETFTQE